MTKEVQITFDCADPAGLAAFWAKVLGYQVQPPPDGFDS
ncbi:MAG: VOC family protein, partial [Geodermatophilaceae bacterium]|nr:VOC family protein [Geodermatophilaceae bacterium]